MFIKLIEFMELYLLAHIYILSNLVYQNPILFLILKFIYNKLFHHLHNFIILHVDQKDNLIRYN